MYLINLKICPHTCFRPKIEDSFEFKINVILAKAIHCSSKEKCQNHVYIQTQRIWGDIVYTRPCTDVNPDGVPKLQHYQDTYITYCTKFGCRKAIQITQTLKISYNV